MKTSFITYHFNRKYILEAEQGVRQSGKPTTDGNVTLFAGDLFKCTKYPNNTNPRIYAIPKGCIGIVHDDDVEKISVVRDDCQAARRWLNKHNQKLP